MLNSLGEMNCDHYTMKLQTKQKKYKKRNTPEEDDRGRGVDPLDVAEVIVVGDSSSTGPRSIR